MTIEKLYKHQATVHPLRHVVRPQPQKELWSVRFRGSACQLCVRVRTSAGSEEREGSVQLKGKKYYHFFYSQGKASADLYKSNSGDATGEGNSQSFGLGVNFIKQRENKKNYSHHGIELRLDKVILDDIVDPLNNISYFNFNDFIFGNKLYIFWF